jgi:hypothetical protein
MPSQKKTTPPATPTNKPLPKSREALAGVLRTVQNVLEFLEPIHHGEAMRLAELEMTLQEPLRILKQESFLKAIAEANQNRFAQGGPSISALIPYVDKVEMNRFMDRHEAGRAKLVPPAGAAAGNVQAWRPTIAALGEVVGAEKAIIGHFRDLQQQVISALDENEQSGADKTDKHADKKSSSRVRLPENQDVLRLAKEINDRRDAELSQNDIALQFTKGDERKARNLLRQLRRYPHLISKPEQ